MNHILSNTKKIIENMFFFFFRNFWQKPQTPAIENRSPVAEKRHFIQLYKTEPKEKWEKPICYMNVIEFDTTHQEEEIRRRKWSHELQSQQDFLKHHNHRRTRSDNELQRFYRSNLRY